MATAYADPTNITEGGHVVWELMGHSSKPDETIVFAGIEFDGYSEGVNTIALSSSTDPYQTVNVTGTGTVTLQWTEGDESTQHFRNITVSSPPGAIAPVSLGYDVAPTNTVFAESQQQTWEPPGQQHWEHHFHGTLPDGTANVDVELRASAVSGPVTFQVYRHQGFNGTGMSATWYTDASYGDATSVDLANQVYSVTSVGDASTSRPHIVVIVKVNDANASITIDDLKVNNVTLVESSGSGGSSSAYYAVNALGDYYYPLYVTEEEAKNADVEAGGSGTSHTHRFELRSGDNATLYMPTNGGTHAGTAAEANEYTLYPGLQPVDGTMTGLSGVDFISLDTEKHMAVYADGDKYADFTYDAANGLTISRTTVTGPQLFYYEDNLERDASTRLNRFSFDDGYLRMQVTLKDITVDTQGENFYATDGSKSNVHIFAKAHGTPSGTDLKQFYELRHTRTGEARTYEFLLNLQDNPEWRNAAVITLGVGFESRSSDASDNSQFTITNFVIDKYVPPATMTAFERNGVGKLRGVGFSISGGNTGPGNFPYNADHQARIDDALGKAHGLGFRVLRTWEVPSDYLLDRVRHFNTNVDEGQELVLQVGIWIDHTNIGNLTPQMEAARTLYESYPAEIVAFSVGNEQLSIGDNLLQIGDVIESVAEYKHAFSTIDNPPPVTYNMSGSMLGLYNSDVSNNWRAGAMLDVAKHLDFVSFNLYNLIGRENDTTMTPQVQLNFITAVYTNMLAVGSDGKHGLFTGGYLTQTGFTNGAELSQRANNSLPLHVVLGETGWKSEGGAETVTNTYNLKAFYDGVHELVYGDSSVPDDSGLDLSTMFYFNLSDEGWKDEYGKNDDHWGIFEQGDLSGLGANKLDAAPSQPPAPTTATLNVSVDMTGSEYPNDMLNEIVVHNGAVTGWVLSSALSLTETENNGIYTGSMEINLVHSEFQFQVVAFNRVSGASHVFDGPTRVGNYNNWVVDLTGLAAGETRTIEVPAEEITPPTTALATVNFSVDMSTSVYPKDGYDNVVINGSWPGQVDGDGNPVVWAGWGLTLSDTDGDGVWTGTLTDLPAGTTFEFVVAATGSGDNWSGWGQQFKDLQSNGENFNVAALAEGETRVVTIAADQIAPPPTVEIQIEAEHTVGAGAAFPDFSLGLDKRGDAAYKKQAMKAWRAANPGAARVQRVEASTLFAGLSDDQRRRGVSSKVAVLMNTNNHDDPYNLDGEDGKDETGKQVRAVYIPLTDTDTYEYVVFTILGRQFKVNLEMNGEYSVGEMSPTTNRYEYGAPHTEGQTVMFADDQISMTFGGVYIESHAVAISRPYGADNLKYMTGNVLPLLVPENATVPEHVTQVNDVTLSLPGMGGENEVASATFQSLTIHSDGRFVMNGIGKGDKQESVQARITVAGGTAYTVVFTFEGSGGYES